MAKKTVNDYLADRGQWGQELSALREILLTEELEESIKWGAPCYSYRGQNVVGLNGFKSYFGLWFYLGARLKDEKRVLINAQEGTTQDLRQWRMSSAEDIDHKTISAYVREAKTLVDAGEKPSRRAAKEVRRSAALEAALAVDGTAREAFNRLTPGRQREYIAHIEEAKREATRQKRAEKVLPTIKAGKGLNDRYR